VSRKRDEWLRAELMTAIEQGERMFPGRPIFEYVIGYLTGAAGIANAEAAPLIRRMRGGSHESNPDDPTGSGVNWDRGRL
jgi:hypothetical protein